MRANIEYDLIYCKHKTIIKPVAELKIKNKSLLFQLDDFSLVYMNILISHSKMSYSYSQRKH